MPNSDKFREECGVVAIYSHPEAEKLAYLGLHALQHRGQESAGIASSDGVNLHMHKAMGLVADIFTEDVLAKLRGSLAIGHTRYSTAGDSRGFRPLAMGRIPAAGSGGQDTIVFASETCAFDLIGANYEREVKPGEMVVVGPEGLYSRFYAPAAPQSACIFEHVYFSRPDSQVFGRAVQDSREQLGRHLAIESPADADLVVPVPDSGVTAAMGYAAESGIPLRFGLIRNHYVGRTFIEPQQTVRDFGVKLKLNPVRSLLEGKRVVLIDDSIVRGTTSRHIVRMVGG